RLPLGERRARPRLAREKHPDRQADYSPLATALRHAPKPSDAAHHLLRAAPRLYRRTGRATGCAQTAAACDYLLLHVSRRAPTAPPSIAASHLIPKTLYDLGFQWREVNSVEVILPPLCDVPAGPFTMGSDKARDQEAYDNETPECLIEVGTFQIARFPVTVA